MMSEELKLKKINDEVFLAIEEIVRLDQRAVDFIKEKATDNLRGRARICAHKKPTDHLHEMLIAIRSDSYIRPHRHHNKVESFHLIEGCADIVILTHHGEIADRIRLSKDHCFYYRLDAAYYHTLIIYSPLLVIHEITNGPFNPDSADYGEFSPDESEKNKIISYMTMMKEKISVYMPSDTWAASLPKEKK
jgi:cupin fold WbuC family metalloprotein